MYTLLNQSNYTDDFTNKMKQKYFIVLFVSICFTQGLFAQVDENNEPQYRQSGGDENFWDDIYVGGSFWMQFGTVTFINVSPLVGYRFTDKFSAGPGIVYQYMKDKRYSPDYETNVYGGRLFARHTIFEQFFAQAQYENLNTDVLYVTQSDYRLVREWVPGFFLGGGIYQPLGRRGAIVISGMYNLLHDDEKSPYPSPWLFNVGFTL